MDLLLEKVMEMEKVLAMETVMVLVMPVEEWV
jgi:hypothetical protein